MGTNRDNPTPLSNLGKVILVRGSVVDIRFEARLPPIYSLLRAGDEGRIVIEVLAQLNARRVRGIALASHPGPRSQHDGGGHGRPVEGAGGQRDSIAYVRRVR